MTITSEQLGAVAVRLGGTKLVPASTVIVQCGPTDKWYFEGRNADGDGFYPIWSDGSLLPAILNRAAEMGYKPDLRRTLHDHPRELWNCEMTPEGPPDSYGATPLEAAILAFIQLPVKP